MSEAIRAGTKGTWVERSPAELGREVRMPQQGVSQPASAVKRPSISVAEFRGDVELSDASIKEILRFGKEMGLRNPADMVAELNLSGSRLGRDLLPQRLEAAAKHEREANRPKRIPKKRSGSSTEEIRECFEEGVGKIRWFHEWVGRAPTQTEMRRELDMYQFERRLREGQFKSRGAKDLNSLFDLLGMDHHKGTAGIWIGQKGLDRGAAFFQEFNRENGRWPSLKEAREIPGAGTFFVRLYRGVYKPYGVSNYHEALAYAKSKYESGLSEEEAALQVKVPTRLDTVAATQYLRGTGTGLAGAATARLR